MSDYSFLVEDSPDATTCPCLKRIKGAKVVEATDGVDALKKLSEQPFHLIVADINMPLMDGLKLLSIVRKEPSYSHIPVIIVTTEGADADREKGMQLGANAIPKPIQTNALLKAVRDLLKIAE
jgi:two-component system chemotaxis response regulator CheY